MSAIRAARGYTRRDKIVKFTGCYHGHSDALLVKAGSGVMTAGIPDSAGVPAGCTQDTLSAIYNDLASVEALFAEYPKESLRDRRAGGSQYGRCSAEKGISGRTSKIL